MHTTYPLEGCHLVFAQLGVVGVATGVVFFVVRVSCLALLLQRLVASLPADVSGISRLQPLT